MDLNRHFGQMIKLLALMTGLLILFWFPSCKDEPFEYKLDRVPAFSFRLDTFDIVTTDEVLFFEGPTTMHVFDDTTRVLFQRITLQAHGITPKSNEYWFIVDFDTHPDGDAVGLYRDQYDVDAGGISEMRLIVNYAGELIEYRSVPNTHSVYFQVDAQHKEERLMKGIFGGVLFPDGNPDGQGALITDGLFKDIKY
jgi:hypothetical protein